MGEGKLDVRYILHRLPRFYAGYFCEIGAALFSCAATIYQRFFAPAPI